MRLQATPAATPVSEPESEHDVVIVGSGVAGALIGARLAATGLDVLILEAGPTTDRAASVRRYHGGLYAYESPAWAPQPTSSDPDYYYVQTGEVKWDSDYERRVGGTTWHWLGNCPRLLPSDFEMQTRFGVGVDWPMTYDDLEGWYGQAEVELGVAGDGAADAGSPRSGGYPMAPLPIASGDVMFQEAARELGYELLATPQARNSVEGYQGRSICCGNGTCIPICPVQAKYDATYHLDLATADGAEVRENAVVWKVDVDGDGNVAGVHYLDPDRRDHLVTGRVYVMAANGIETPKLLLMSAGENAPEGVANSSDQVGRNLSDHPETSTSALVPRPYAGSRGPLQLSGIDALREGEFRSERAALRFQIGHSTGNPLNLARTLIGEGLAGRELYERIASTAPYQVRVATMSEQLPDPENRVLPHETEVDDLGLPRPHLIYSHDDYTRAGLDVALQFHHDILELLGATELVDAEAPYGVGHLMGTYRMGDDPSSSVTDREGRAHDHPNLWMAGSGLFPTMGTANPTLTIAALALLTADAIGREFNVQVPVATPVASPEASPVATPAAD
jgi:choline dehydrogenase-like flavoprotein